MQEKREIDELIVNLLSESITPGDREELYAWINESVENKTYFAQLKNIWEGTHPAFDPESIDVSKAEARVLENIRDRSWIHSPVFIWWQRIAAIMIVPVLLAMGYFIFKPLSHSTVLAYQEVFAPYGMHSKIDLPDGSTVWLNSGSKLKYPLAFDGKERNVSLSGEAFFKVHADKSHPFIVATQGLDVTATGTQFNVEAYASDTITAITLVEGKVDVDMSGIIKEKLKPNQRLVLNSITNNYKLTETDAQHWGMWKDGILAFRDEPLEEVFKRIGRNFNVDIKVKDPVVGKQLYRATFERESFEEILRLLKMTSPIQYKRIGRVRQPDNEYTKERIEVYKAN